MSFIQGNTHQNGAGAATTVAVTLGSPVAVGNSIFISVGIGGSDGTETVAIQDDKGNVYVIKDQRRDAAQTYSWQLAYFSNAINSPQTITATISGSRSFLTIMADEHSNVGVFDKSALNDQVAPGNGTDVITSGSVTTSANGELIYSSCVCVNSDGIVIGTGFSGNQSPAVAFTFISESKLQVSAGAVAATYTATVGGSSFLTGIMTFQAPIIAGVTNTGLAQSEW